jgi:hypothetical protein
VRAALLLLAACGRPAITSCEQDIGGVYVFEGARWILVDRGATLEAFPLFPDVPVVAETEVAPRVIDLDRTPAGVAGHVKRRYMRGAKACIGKAPARVTACRSESIDIVLSDPVPPLEVAPCTFPRHDGNRRERWLRE